MAHHEFQVRMFARGFSTYAGSAKCRYSSNRQTLRPHDAGVLSLEDATAVVQFAAVEHDRQIVLFRQGVTPSSPLVAGLETLVAGKQQLIPEDEFVPGEQAQFEQSGIKVVHDIETAEHLEERVALIRLSRS